MEKRRRDGETTRVFIATTYEEFWKRYSGLSPDERHHYEIIRQGWPCHLYFGENMQLTALD